MKFPSYYQLRAMKKELVNNAEFPVLPLGVSYTGWRRETKCDVCNVIQVCAEVKDANENCAFLCAQHCRGLAAIVVGEYPLATRNQ